MRTTRIRSFQAGKRIPTHAGEHDRRRLAQLDSAIARSPRSAATSHDVVTVSEESIVAAMRAVWEVLKIVIEPSGAVSYAAIVENRIDVRGKRVGIILTGGNLDLDALPWQ